jgi:hypothetical protein
MRKGALEELIRDRRRNGADKRRRDRVADLAPLLVRRTREQIFPREPLQRLSLTDSQATALPMKGSRVRPWLRRDGPGRPIGIELQ